MGRLIGLLCGGALLLASALAGPALAATTPLSQVGTSGSGAGQLDQPQDVEIDAGGNIYVADSGNHRISQFAPNGAFVRAFGWNVDPTGGPGTLEVCTTATGCQVGAAGAGAGQFFFPLALALDGAGNLYAISQNHHRVDVFSLAGPSFTRAFGYGVATGSATTFESCTTSCVSGVAGPEEGQLNLPSGIEFADGAVVVADRSNHRISIFNPSTPAFTSAFGYGVLDGSPAVQSCSASCQAGTSGNAAGQLSFPNDSEFGSDGDLYVSDNLNRISRFDISPVTFIHAFGGGVANGTDVFQVCTTFCVSGIPNGTAGSVNGPVGMDADASGNLHVAESNNDRISQFSLAGPSFVQAFGFGVDTAAAGFQVCTTASGCESGDPGAAFGQLDSPRSVALDLCGSLWVSDAENDRLQRFGEPGTQGAPPCVLPAATPPSNTFDFGKVKLSKKKGTAKLPVEAPGPGRLQLSGKGIKGVSAQTSAVVAASTIKLTVKAKGKTAKTLKKKGKIKVKAVVTFTPTGGVANSKTKKVTLRRS